ncbi:MAG: HAD-IA family hydrolase [Anaerolineales bacterium]|nr:HAD-IA family hydrolase [Anaerolineales bacterium]
MFKALIFDFDGLILDTETPEVVAWQEVYSRYGVEFPIDLWGQIVGGNGAVDFDPVTYLTERSGQVIDTTLMRADKRVRDRELIAYQDVLPGVQDYLAAARALGLQTAIASSSTHEWVDNQLKRLGLFEAFDFIICREDADRPKPNPDLFLKALEVLRARPDEAIVFEDSPNGVKAGQAAGLRVVAVPNPVTIRLGMDGGDLTLNSLADLALPGLLARFGETLTIRPEIQADLPGIRQVNEQAFERPNEAQAVDLIRARGHASLSMVAVEDGRVLGHVLFSPMRFEPPRPGLTVLGLGPVAVLPEVQKTGIGSRLIRAGLEACRRQGVEAVLLVGHESYYPRFGFTPARTFGLTSEYGDGDFFMIIELCPGSLEGVQGRVTYVPEFKETAC